jgi:hypothetical protein
VRSAPSNTHDSTPDHESDRVFCHCGYELSADLADPYPLGQWVALPCPGCGYGHWLLLAAIEVLDEPA